VTIQAATKADLCAGNTLWLGDLTEAAPKVSRAHLLTYEIPKKGSQTDAFRVPAKEVHSALPAEECPVTTYSVWYDPITLEWKETRADTYKTVNMEDGKKYVDLSFTQEYFLNDLDMWKLTHALDESIYITAMFVTIDPAGGANVTDEFTVEIKGSGEPLSIYCDYGALSVATSQGAVEYQVTDPSPAPAARVSVDFESTLAGEVPEMCMSLVRRSLDFNLPDGTVWTLWNEGDEYDENADSGFWVVDELNSDGTTSKKLRMAVTQEDFRKRGQTGFNTLSQTITIPAQYSWRNEYDRVILADTFTITV
jgi:hypothetical protein